MYVFKRSLQFEVVAALRRTSLRHFECASPHSTTSSDRKVWAGPPSCCASHSWIRGLRLWAQLSTSFFSFLEQRAWSKRHQMCRRRCHGRLGTHDEQCTRPHPAHRIFCRLGTRPSMDSLWCTVHGRRPQASHLPLGHKVQQELQILVISRLHRLLHNR